MQRTGEGSEQVKEFGFGGIECVWDLENVNGEVCEFLWGTWRWFKGRKVAQSLQKGFGKNSSIPGHLKWI